MATTYTLISSNVLTGSAASVTFSSIPSTYTDLVVKASIRSDRAGTVENIACEINATTTNYSFNNITGSGSSAGANIANTETYLRFTYGGDGDTATTSTFSNFEMYIPSYLISQNKPISGFSGQETNATAAYLVATAGLWRNTAAITQIKFSPILGSNFVSGSSFYLYGIKNS